MTGFAGPALGRPVATGLARKGAAPQPDARTRTARHLAAGKRLGQAFGRGIGTGFDRDGLQGGGSLVLRGCGRTQGPERQSDRNRSQGEGRRMHELKYY